MELPDSTEEALCALAKFGRFETTLPEKPGDLLELEFHNDYD